MKINNDTDHLSAKEFVTILTIAFSFITFNIFTITSWYFSAIGDEYAFFTFARGIARGSIKPNIFSQQGVYNVIPILSSYYQAFWMKVFGTNVFGWKVSHVILIALTIPSVYFIAKKLFSSFIAILGSITYASSHLVWAYVHTGYSNIEGLFPFLYSILFTIYRKYFIAGLFLGLGFFTFYTARLSFPLVLLWAILDRKTISLRRSLTRLFAGFSIFFLPYLFVNKSSFFTAMMNRSIISQSDGTYYGPWYKFILDNIVRNGIAPWYNTRNYVYVTGSLVDTISGMFLIFGIFYTLRFIKKPIYLFTFSLFFLPLLIISVTSPYSYVVISRYHIVIPGISLLVAVGINYLIKPFHIKNIHTCILIVILFSIVYLNIYRFLFISPKKMQITEEAYVMYKLTETACKYNDTNIVVGSMARSPNNLLKQVLEAYGLINKTILVEYRERYSDIISKAKGQKTCIISFQ